MSHQRTGTRRRLTAIASAVSIMSIMSMACVGMLASSATASASTADPTPTPLSDITAAVGAGDVPVSYVVLIDVSGSMLDGGLYGRVKAALPGVVGALGPNDSIAVDTFGNGPETVRRLLPVHATPSAAHALDGVRVDPNASTDMGGALNLAHTQLLGQQPNAKVGVVLLLTDGKPDISADLSKYAMPGVTTDSSSDAIKQGIAASPSWRAIRTGFDTLAAQGMTVLGCGLPLRPGLDLSPVVNGVFSSGYIDATPGVATLHDFIVAAEAQARIALVRAAVKDSDKKGVTAGLTLASADSAQNPIDLRAGAAAATLTLTLTSPDQRVPITVSNLRVTTSGGLPLTVSGLGQPVDVAPGKPVRIPIVLHWTPPPAASMFGDAVTRTDTLHITADLASSWTKTLDAGVTPGFAVGPLTTAPAALTVNEPGTVDSTPWLLLALLIVIVVAAALLGRRVLVHELSGSLEIKANGAVTTVALANRRQLVEQCSLGGSVADISILGPVRGSGNGIRIRCDSSDRVLGDTSGRCRNGDVLVLAGRWQFAWTRQE